MPTLTIRQIPTEVHEYLRQRAARNGRSMEAEVRDLLQRTMQEDTRKPGLVAQAVRRRFAMVEPGEALQQPQRPPLGQPVAFRK
ncbi:FitA-like ribbon-helix-helix domain-containing protein [Sulfitobacter sabulilitoris]|uniref:Arc family DNA-binding protein n=1 Tax=Sulfitobacter sabulilitoris TaxID=2562655 RepID=A0A5S3PAJ7_9RHOB|nr:Arc family DNA-binding protein [Sulfitobacter sabulilitoris]TMM50562.1 Arc family DNA-binding protein [Sulfitobacter sabulilitoris]